jgi:4-amino-4-deoxy-L-arabinose transferase
VYFGWLILNLIQKKFRIKYFKSYLTAFLVTLIVALPWQVFTFIQYPEEAIQAYRLNALHFTIAIDGHGGNFWYHFNKLPQLYGLITCFMILPGMFLLYKRSNSRDLILSLLSMVFIVYLFFSIAATKMPAFPLVIVVILLVSITSLWDYFLILFSRVIKSNVWIKVALVLSILGSILMRFDIEYLQEKHTDWKDSNAYGSNMEYNRNIYKSLELPDGTVIFNLKDISNIESMFYSGYTSYNFVPTADQLNDVKSKNRPIAFFNWRTTDLPEYITGDSSIIFITHELR